MKPVALLAFVCQWKPLGNCGLPIYNPRKSTFVFADSPVRALNYSLVGLYVCLWLLPYSCWKLNYLPQLPDQLGIFCFSMGKPLTEGKCGKQTSLDFFPPLKICAVKEQRVAVKLSWVLRLDWGHIFSLRLFNSDLLPQERKQYAFISGVFCWEAAINSY